MRKIKSVERVIDLADKKRAIKHVYHSRPIAAAFYQNWPARVLVNSVRSGYLYEYPKKHA